MIAVIKTCLACGTEVLAGPEEEVPVCASHDRAALIAALGRARQQGRDEGAQALLDGLGVPSLSVLNEVLMDVREALVFEDSRVSYVDVQVGRAEWLAIQLETSGAEGCRG